MSRIEELNEGQAKFAEFYLEFNNGTLAAIKAGYSEKSAHVQASQLLKNPKVRDYIEELRSRRSEAVVNRIGHMAVDVINGLYDLAQHAESESVRLNAIKDILDRGGFKPVEKNENKNTLDGKIEFGFVDPSLDDDD